jgi:hypothetical protein
MLDWAAGNRAIGGCPGAQSAVDTEARFPLSSEVATTWLPSSPG